MNESAILKTKRSYFYQPSAFPWTEHVQMNNVKEQAHFVLSEQDLREGFVSLGDFQAGNYVAQSKLTILCFLAEAMHYSQRFRGVHHGSTFVGDNPRTIVVINYLTTEVFINRESAIPRSREQMYFLDNIRGVLISIFICDEDLSFADMCSDMMNINAHGLPQFKQRTEFAEVEMNDNNQPAEDVPHAPRPDKPGMLLGVKGTKYTFSNDPQYWSRFQSQYQRLEDTSFLTVNNLNPLILLIQIWTRRFGYVVQQISESHMIDLGAHSEYQIRNAFSFANALEAISVMNVDPIFKRRENWFNTIRGEHGQESFGAPCWYSGQVMPTMDGGERRAHASGCIKSALLAPGDLFRAGRIQDTIMPHCTLDENRADDGRQFIRVQGVERTIDVKGLLESVGIVSSFDKQMKKKQSELNRDPFNEIFERVSAEEMRLLSRLGNPLEPSSDFLEHMAALREKGRQLYLALSSQVASPVIPEGIRFQLSWRLGQPADMAPIPEHMWHDFNTGLTSYGQVKHRQLLITESVIKTADTQLFLFPVVWRAGLSVMFPKVGNTLYKEHLQIICAPGTSKSTLLDLISEMRIPYSHETEGGASGMGLVGDHCSQRMLQIFHELDEYYAPIEEPKGENGKIHKMMLGCLSEGRKKYRTTVEAMDPFTGLKSRASSRMESEDTNVRIGARNYNSFIAKSGGSAAAMYDRFTQVMLVQINSPRRVSIFSQVLNSGPSSITAAKLQAQQQFRMCQDLVGRFCMAVECGWLPFPELTLFSDLAPMMTGFLAARYPHFHSQLRKVGCMKTRQFGDVVWDRAWKILFTPLNPTSTTRRYTAQEMIVRRMQAEFENKAFDPTPWITEMGPYEPEKLLLDMAKMMVCTYDSLFFVMTERLREMTNAPLLTVLAHIAENSGNFFSYGRKSCDTEMKIWPIERTGSHPKMWTLDGMIAELLQRYKNPDTGRVTENAIYKVYIPVTENMLNFQRSQKPDASGATGEVGYSELGMTRERVPPEYEDLYETSSIELDEPVRLHRDTAPVYKREKIQGVDYYNVNYVKIEGTIYTYANRMSGMFGDIQLDKEGFIQMLEMAASEYMVTPMIPLIKDSEILSTPESLGYVQSLRYIPGAMRHFPKYRLPALINDKRRGCFYLLVSYFETNFNRMCEDMIEYVSYAATPRREILLGIPATNNRFYYQSYKMRPTPGKRLTIGNKTNSRPETQKVLRSYTFDVKTGMGLNTGHANSADKVYHDKCIETERATEYLLRNFSAKDPAVLDNWLPAAIERRLRLHYEEYPDHMITESYDSLVRASEMTRPLLEDVMALDETGTAVPLDDALRRKRDQRTLDQSEGRLSVTEDNQSSLKSNPGYGDHFEKTGQPRLPILPMPGALPNVVMMDF